MDVEKTLEFPFGKAYCNKKYVYFERVSEEIIDAKDAKILFDGIYAHFQNRKFVYISHRKSAPVIDLNSYKYVNQKQILGIAIVSNGDNLQIDLLKEQSLFEGPFASFRTLKQAIAWSETFEG